MFHLSVEYLNLACVYFVGSFDVGMEVMHERNAHNFPLDLAAVEAPSTNG
jgi:hypothetical protein